MTIVSERQQRVVLPVGYSEPELVFDGACSRVYRARRHADGCSVILKALKDGELTRETVARFQHEYEIARRLQAEHVIRLYALEWVKDRPVIAMEDIGGESLDQLAARRPLTLEECLTIGMEAALGLAELHANKVIHKDINPSNIVYNESRGTLKIIDFGISSYLPRERTSISAPRVVPGTLAYMSPEQTGRMNRTIDYRTDFYSLGAALYELLTRRRLFDVSDAIEWFHCHIAREPTAPIEVDPQIPQAVSDIVVKLLAKNAEDRYQSALGIHADLGRCLEQLRETGRIQPFVLATRDVPEQFQVPQRLYGREREVETLLAAFEQARQGGVAIALVSGPSGIGKSCLINELYKPITAKRGYFVAGKFDQLHRGIPYSAFATALRDLVRQLLTESAEQVARWQAKILDAVGANARLVIDLIPELELITGPQPPVPTLPPLESEQRFRLALRNFIRVFSRVEHPLVLVLDDLQWADAGTLKLAELMIDTIEGDSLLVIGAFRDGELDPKHPLMQTLGQLTEGGVPMTLVTLDRLQVPDLCRLLADALRATAAEVEPLARLVAEKTEGNPFFVDEFLRTLHREGLLSFDAAAGHWAWDLEGIKAQRSTDNVVDLMTHKLRRLPAETQRLLQLASCAGNRFSLSVLSIMAEQPPRAVAARLREAMAEGLVAPVRDAYQLIELEQAGEPRALTVEFAFAHDRIQQTAYGLLDQQAREAAHLRIGRLLLAGLSPEQRDENLFVIVNHLNLGSALIEEVQQRDELCRLNLAAARRASQAAAFRIGFGHLQCACALLGEDGWQRDYPLALEVYAQAAEAACLCSEYQELEVLLAAGDRHARDLLDKVPFYESQVAACIARGEMAKAIEIAKPVLHQLKHHYPAQPNRLHIALKMMALKRRMRGVSPEMMRDLPPMTDPVQLAALRIGARLGSAAMFAQPALLPLMVISGVTTSLDYGYADSTPAAYATLGMILAGSLGKVDEGIGIARLGMALAQKQRNTRSSGRTLHIYAALVQHFKDPLRRTLDNLRQAQRLCLESGDFEYAIHASSVYGRYGFLAGLELEQLEQEAAADIASFKALQQGPLLYHQRSMHQTILNLLGRSDDPRRLVGESYDIDKMLALHEKDGDKALVNSVHNNAMFLSYYFGDDQAALAHAEAARHTTRTGAFYTAPWLDFMGALIYLRAAGQAGKPERRRMMRAAARAQAGLARSARKTPVNFQNKYHLVEAERLRVTGQDFLAHAEFDRAIALSREHGFLHEQALASELCGAMHMAAGRPTLGLPYLREARELYHRWGALAKVQDLDDRFPQLVATRSMGGTSSGIVPMESVDITSLMKALKAIADEQVYSRMVAAVIDAAIEFAGAQRGVLVLRNPAGELCIEAEAAIDGESKLLQSQPLVESRAVSQSVVNYVARTRTGVVIHDALAAGGQIPGLEMDEHVLRDQVRSVLCLPIVAGASAEVELMGLLYLENNHASNCFTDQRFGTLEIICLAAAGRLELSRKAAVDGLTNLFNHDYFQNMLKQELAASVRHRRDLSLILLDIDHFKRFNDSWGHPVGDRVLREVAELLKLNSREGDTVARYGGEEMAVILPLTGRADAIIVAERLRRAVESHVIVVEGQPLAVTVSLGLACVSETVADAVALIRRADAALYQSKAKGRNRLTVAD